jgi:hypothetical protein
MTFRIEGKDRARKESLRAIEALERRFVNNLEALVLEIDDHIKSLTPVNTGQAVRNYIWTTGTPNVIIYDAIDNGPTGATNRMALGTEPRRRTNEDAAFTSLTSLSIKTKPYEMFYLTNMSPDIVGLEAGILPGPPFQSRSPNGMFGLTSGYIKTLVSARGMLR